MSALIELFVKYTEIPLIPSYISIAMIVSIVIVTQLFKLPYKRFITSKIADKDRAMLANMVIMFLPFGFGILGSFILSLFGYQFCYKIGLLWGSGSIVFYNFAEIILKNIKKGKKITQKTIAEAVVEAEKATEETKSEFEKLVEKAKKGVK